MGTLDHINPFNTNPPPLKPLSVILILLVLTVLVLLIAKKLGVLSANLRQDTWPFYVKKPLTQPELILYHRLVKALPDHIVLAQVQVSRILGVKKGTKFNEWNNRINRLSYDFVVCTKDSTVIAAIELDDKSYEKASRQSTDDKKNKASSDAGLRLVRWHVRSLPDEQAIRQEFSLPQSIEALPKKNGKAAHVKPNLN